MDKRKGGLCSLASIINGDEYLRCWGRENLCGTERTHWIRTTLHGLHRLVGVSRRQVSALTTSHAPRYVLPAVVSSLHVVNSIFNPPDGKWHEDTNQPTISTFSDHIVISYPLKRLAESLGEDGESRVAVHVLQNFSSMADRIAVGALSIGF